ncbi:MAG TPA: pyruvate dehydrogenase (acetyl-transferring), homodimeric type [Gammaproteobacteria bacterium]|nr:pyruvate dehydrogenase (acetyl-transferring), homodimeric type [Gammaproteobacteria bacterium]MEC8011273.1 pyruvate dehydrogenase (acetyl-transferring), homodimeric type [Pseudomonadota bacterium]HBF09756.1 pyruvate dehydrogenase (acetyl-transferring), homodimeric type [Gammaproteobacteria bacterium]HCK92136.1 pyruvate dehydrogenase (acetyl-transferring), homodimeric type [Gammaproteobacteria bacterium]|tara:strand:+ start:34618 stop:37287 length:2670 start_codon:yes stop_codon:yes gene_type:complete
MTIENYYGDEDAQETKEWMAAFESLLKREGPERAYYLLEKLTEAARTSGVNLKNLTTPYKNTIRPENEPKLPGDQFIERRIRSMIRWNALAMVMRANMNNDDELGGHISSYASSATLYEIGFNHFFKGQNEENAGDLIYFQGHASPGMYARAFLEGRISEAQLDNFRREVDGQGLSSYPHPWLMPEFWQFPTVSMGLGPIQAIYQARFAKYLQNQGKLSDENQKVWAFLGDGETDEPESLGAISLAGREKLDNLIFVVNCNLQRLDGPVRGNAKIIQELEGVFRGAGWNVIKVVWGRHWDQLFERDKTGVLRKRMEECVDGEFQAFKTHGGAYTREHFFNKYPELAELVKDYTDEDIENLNRGGHDPYKVYAAYHQAVNHKGAPTVILAKTVKGYGTGAGEAQNKTHQIKKLDLESLKEFRDKFNIPVSDEDLPKLPYFKPADDSAEMRYLHDRRRALGGYLPKRNANREDEIKVPELGVFGPLLEGTGNRQISTTMGIVRMMGSLVKQQDIGDRIVPIVPDEARTFGMEGMFRQLGIYSSVGQLYKPEDAGSVMYYREDIKGRILEEGINEAGAMSSWIASATSYANYGFTTIPFYIYYSMFGFQRIGDLAWAAGDLQARGFMVGGTSGRTTLNGEGLQHQDGHSHLMASTIPNCVAYDPAYNYELAVIVHNGLKRMVENKENVFYYITTLNENYEHPALPEGAEEGIIKGMYKLKAAEADSKARVHLLGSGSILQEAVAAAELLKDIYDVESDLWSVTSFTELRRDGLAAERWNMLNPLETRKTAYVSDCLNASPKVPVIAVTDYMKIHADQIRPFVRNHFTALGTDGFGRSDSREKLRHHFEVNRYFIVIAALSSLADKGVIGRSKVQDAIERFNIDPNKVDPQYA